MLTEDDRAKIREMSRKLANASAARVSDAELPRIAGAVRDISDGLMDITDSPESAAQVAAAFASLLSSLDSLPVSIIGRVIEDTIATYGLVAGHVTGTFALPEGVAIESGDDPEILFGDERDIGK